MPDGTSAPKTGACPKNSEPCGPPGGEIPGTGTYFRSDLQTGQNAGTENRSQSRISPEAQVVQWQLAGHPAVKIGVRTAGWYRVTQAQLVAAGVSALVDPRRLQLYTDGVEQAIQVRGEADGRLDPPTRWSSTARGSTPAGRTPASTGWRRAPRPARAYRRSRLRARSIAPPLSAIRSRSASGRSTLRPFATARRTTSSGPWLPATRSPRSSSLPMWIRPQRLSRGPAAGGHSPESFRTH